MDYVELAENRAEQRAHVKMIIDVLLQEMFWNVLKKLDN
jgi:hypothetical protein